MPIALTDILALVGAALLAAVGGECFLRAIAALASRLRVPPALVATTVAAFATSCPELTVSIMAALSGHPEIGLGNVLGSNVVNIALIFGLALLLGPLQPSRREFGRDYGLALLVPLLTLLFFLDGRLSRIEGAMLLLLFLGWLGLIARSARQYRREAESSAFRLSSPNVMMALGLGAFGLAALVASGRLFVTGAIAIAGAFGVHTYMVGALIVAIGTTLPELATVVLSRLRGQDAIGVGTLIGSNLFNGLAIVGVAATIHPIAAQPGEIATALAGGLAALLLLIPNRSGILPRSRGLLLLCVYGLFFLATWSAGQH